MKIPLKKPHLTNYLHFPSSTNNSNTPLSQLISQIDKGESNPGEIAESASSPENLKDISPRDAQKAIEMLARGYTDSKDEKAIVNILQAMTPKVRGEALRLIAGGGDRHTIESLLSDDIDDKKLNRQAAALIQEARPFMANPSERLIISDVDDTVKPWKDKSVTGPVFPGVKALYKALDLGFDGTGNSGDVHFVTARDGNVISAEEDIKNTGIDTNSIRYGDGLSGLLSLMGSTKGVEDRKVKNITEMLHRNPTNKAVLIGDSTQADPAVFQRILDSNPDRVELLLVHRVSGFDVAPEIENNPKFLIFDTYKEAATVLHERGIISASQLQDVIDNK